MKTILVADDNEQNLSVAKSILSSEYKVIPVAKGQQALTYLESGDCDIFLLDINMPDMDGFELLAKIRKIERFSNTPVIFFTADHNPDIETRCFKEGANDFIIKPFIPEVMLSRIGRILELEELRRSLADRLEQKTKEVSDIKSKSHQETLTGLWNRTYAEELINEMLAKGAKGALFMMDMDNFKLINDSYGHMSGDEVLKMLADTLRELSSEEDVLCRLGGDEFMMFVKDVTAKDELIRRALAIITDMSGKIEEQKFDTNTSVSIGIAQAPEDGTDFSKLYNSADKALYYVKQNGKNSCHFFSDKLQAENSRSGKTVDLKYLIDLMSRGDKDRGTYQLDFESFHHVYNFIRRFVERSNRDVQAVLFTLSTVSDERQPDTVETESALELLEKAIYTSLRRSDVSTRYSSKQLIVILMDTNSENAEMVAERIINGFYKMYTVGKVKIDYGVARIVEKKGG